MSTPNQTTATRDAQFERDLQYIKEVASGQRTGSDMTHREAFERAHELTLFDNHTNHARESMSKDLFEAMTAFLKTHQKNFMGYQVAQDLHATDARLGELLNMHVNNVGDPFYDNDGFRMNAKAAERAILAHYGALWTRQPSSGSAQATSDVTNKSELTRIHAGGAHAFTEAEGPDSIHDINATRGYVTCMGSTEGNTYLCRQARDYLKGKFLLPEYAKDGGEMHFANRAAPHEPVSLELREPHHHGTIRAGHVVSPRTVKVHGKHYSLVSASAGSPHSPHPQTLHSPNRPKTGIHNTNHHFREPVILYSKAAHYSIGKIKDMLEIHTPLTFVQSLSPDQREAFGTPRTRYLLHEDADEALFNAAFPRGAGDEWPAMIPSHEDGTMNLDALAVMVKIFFAHGNPVIVICNFGSTFTGIHDNPTRVTEIIRAQPGCVEATCTKNEDSGIITLTRRNYFVGVDGALGGAYGAYFDKDFKSETNQKFYEYMADANNKDCPYYIAIKKVEAAFGNFEGGLGVEQRNACMVPIETIVLPSFNLSTQTGVMAVSMSSHKFHGSATPGGLIMTAQKYMLNFMGADVSYIGSPDTSISGSRSALNVMILYDNLARHSHARQITKYYACYNTARFAAYAFSRSIGATMASVNFHDDPAEPAELAAFKAYLRQQDALFNKSHAAVVVGAGGGADASSAAVWMKPPTVFNYQGSLSVILPRPSRETVDKYALSCDSVRLDASRYCVSSEYLARPDALVAEVKTAGGEHYYVLKCVHSFIMSHVSTEMILSLSEALKADAGIRDFIGALSSPAAAPAKKHFA